MKFNRITIYKTLSNRLNYCRFSNNLGNYEYINRTLYIGKLAFEIVFTKYSPIH